MSKRPAHWTVVVLSENQAQMRQFRFHKNWFIVALAAAFGLLVLLFVFAGLTLSLSGKIEDTAALKAHVEELEASNARVRDIAERVAELKQFEEQLRRGLQLPQSSLPDAAALEPSAHQESPRYEESRPSDLAGIFTENLAEVSTEGILPSDIPTHPPVRGYVTRKYEPSSRLEDPGHYGLDVAGRAGTTISVSANGLVVFAGWSYPYGNLVVVSHKSGYTTFYGHNQTLLVEPGDRVLMGQPIALLGNSGRSSAPHLHFEIWKDGSRVDPETVLARSAG